MGRKDDYDIGDEGLDNLDFGDFDDFDDFNEKDTRSTAKGKKYGRVFGKGVGEGMKKRIYKDVADKMPNTASLIEDTYDAYEELKYLKDDVQESAAELLRESKKIVRPLLPIAKKLLPSGWYDKLDQATIPEEIYKQISAAEAKRQREDSTIGKALSEVFDQTKATQTMTEAQSEAAKTKLKMDQTNRLMDLKLTRDHHNIEMAALLGVKKELEISNAFKSSALTGYMKKSLELQYRQLFAMQDMVETARASFKLDEVSYQKIIHNTALPETQKILMSERYKDRLKAGIVTKVSDVVGNIVPTMIANLRKSILNPMKMLKDFAGETGDMLTEFMDEDSEVTLDPVEEATNLAGVGLGGVIMGPVMKKILSLTGDKYSQLEGATQDWKMKLYGKLMQTKEKASGDYSIRSQLLSKTLEALLPTHSLKDTVERDAVYKNPYAPAEFDVSVRQAIVEVMPGYLSMLVQRNTEMVNLLKGESGPVEQMVFDSKTRRFKTTSDLQKDHLSGIYSTGSMRNIFDRELGRLKGEHISAGGKEVTFDNIQADLKRFITNHSRKPWVDFKALQDFADSDRPISNASRYIRDNFAGTKEPKALARFIIDMVSVNGKVSRMKTHIITNPIIETHRMQEGFQGKALGLLNLPEAQYLQDLLHDPDDAAKGKHLRDGTMRIRNLNKDILDGVLTEDRGITSEFRAGFLNKMQERVEHDEIARKRREFLLSNFKHSIEAQAYDPEFHKAYMKAELSPASTSTKEVTMQDRLAVEQWVNSVRGTDSPLGRIMSHITLGGSGNKPGNQISALFDSKPIVDELKGLRGELKTIYGERTSTNKPTFKFDLTETNDILKQIQTILEATNKTSFEGLTQVVASLKDIQFFNYHGGDPEKFKTLYGKTKGFFSTNFSRLGSAVAWTGKKTTDAIVWGNQTIPKLVGSVLGVPLRFIRGLSGMAYGKDAEGNPNKNVAIETTLLPFKIMGGIFSALKGKASGVDVDGLGTQGKGIVSRLYGGVKDLVFNTANTGIGFLKAILPPAVDFSTNMGKLGLGAGGKAIKGIWSWITGESYKTKVINRLDMIISLIGGTELPKTGTTTSGSSSGEPASAGGPKTEAKDRSFEELKKAVKTQTDKARETFSQKKERVKAAATELNERVQKKINPNRPGTEWDRDAEIAAMKRQRDIQEQKNKLRRNVNKLGGMFRGKREAIFSKLKSVVGNPNATPEEIARAQATATIAATDPGNSSRLKRLVGLLRRKRPAIAVAEHLKGLTPEEAAKAAVLASAVGQEKQETEGGPKGLFDRLKEAVKSKSSGLLESFGAAMGGTAAGAALAKHGIKGAAMAGIGKLAGGAAWLGKTAIVSGALAGLKGLALTTGALVSSPVVIGLVTTAAVGYGVYKLYGAYKRNTFPSIPAKFFQIRKQSLYAIQMPVDDSIIYQMEMDILSSQPSPEDPGMAIRPITDAMIRGYMRQFKTLNPKNPTHYATFKHWYEHRFTPVFEQFIRIMSHYNTYRSKLQPPQPPLDYIAVHRAVKGTDDYNYFMAATTQIKPQRSDIVLSKSAADGFFSNAAAYGATSMYKDRGEQMMQYIENQGPDSQDFGTKDASTPRSRSSNPRARNTGADKAWKALEAETKVYSKDETTSSYNQLREKTKAWIKGHEGLRFKPYLDSLQFNTIGYGHKNIHGLTYVDKATADALFERDFAKAESLASQLPMYAQLDPVRRMALVNMVFNMGLGQSPSTGFAGSGVRSFKRALTALEMATSVEDPTQRNKLFDEAAKEVLSSKYATQVKDRAKNVAEVLKTGKIQMMKVKPINVTDHERDSLDKDTLASLKQSKFASEDYDKQYMEQAVKDVVDNPTFTPKQMAAQTMTDFSKSKVGISVSANKISVIVDGISFFNGSFEHYQEFLLKQYGDQGSVPDSLRYFTQGNAQVDVFKLVSHKPKVKEESANRFKSVAKPNISAAEAMAAGMGVPQLELKMDEGELADNTRESNTLLQGIHEVLSKLLYKAENPDKEVPKEPVKPPQPPVRGARRTNTGPKTITVPFPT